MVWKIEVLISLHGKKVCLPKEQGGLGVMDLGIQNRALLPKHLHKFFNCHDLPWVKFVHEKYYSNGSIDGRLICSFRWKCMTRLISTYKKLAMPGEKRKHNHVLDRRLEWCTMPETIR